MYAPDPNQRPTPVGPLALNTRWITAETLPRSLLRLNYVHCPLVRIKPPRPNGPAKSIDVDQHRRGCGKATAQ